MRHLVIGSGNMGRKHAQILQELGDKVDLCDLEFKPGDHVEQYNSLLVCTPAETHAGLIKALACYETPLFVEKPVFSKSEHLEYPDISMVACNWRWCTDITTRGRNSIDCSYPKASQHDLIHFVDRFWEEHGKITDAWPCGDSLVIEDSRHAFRASVTDGRQETLFNGMPLLHSCDMFVKQMKCWREVICGKESPNPISKAVKRTSWLLNLLSLSHSA